MEKMKSLKTLIIVLAIAASYTTVSNAQSLSPRAEANKNRIVSGSTEDLAHKTTPGSPRSQANAARIAAKSDDGGDTLGAIRSSKLSPRAQQQAGDSQFQVAVQAGTCDSPCCKK